MKFNQIWSVSYSHEWGMQRQKKFWPHPLVTLGWGQRSNIIKFRLPCQFQRFLYQTLCVFSQMKDTKHIRRNFNSVAWVMPQGWDFGALGVPKGSKKKFQTWSCSISNRWGWQAEQNARNIFILGSNWWPWGEVKRSNIIYMSISKIFIPNFVCVSQIKDRKHIEQNFHFVARVMPESRTSGAGRSKKI